MKSIPRSTTRHRITYVASALIVFAVVSATTAGTIYAVSKITFDNTAHIDDSRARQSQFLKEVSAIQVTATDFFEAGDIQGGVDYYNSEIAARQDKEEKRVLLRLQSSFALRAGLYDLAVASADEAHTIASDASTVRALADAYKARGDTEQALTYYEKLLALYASDDTKNTTSTTELSALKETIEELKHEDKN